MTVILWLIHRFTVICMIFIFTIRFIYWISIINIILRGFLLKWLILYILITVRWFYVNAFWFWTWFRNLLFIYKLFRFSISVRLRIINYTKWVISFRSCCFFYICYTVTRAIVLLIWCYTIFLVILNINIIIIIKWNFILYISLWVWCFLLLFLLTFLKFFIWFLLTLNGLIGFSMVSLIIITLIYI